MAIIAERKIEEGLQSGAFDQLPQCGRINCSLHGEMFIAWWFRQHYSGNETREEPTATE
ncbi:MAG: hypothetical protein JO322_16755 [Candidatus Eremiobacteraeota bacterium]|nr:hypothetical protein [Candidatus Eremiobacteraeota bacterium]